jgi:hypothetical protein
MSVRLPSFTGANTLCVQLCILLTHSLLDSIAAFFVYLELDLLALCFAVRLQVAKYYILRVFFLVCKLNTALISYNPKIA